MENPAAELLHLPTGGLCFALQRPVVQQNRFDLRHDPIQQVFQLPGFMPGVVVETGDAIRAAPRVLLLHKANYRIQRNRHQEPSALGKNRRTPHGTGKQPRGIENHLLLHAHDTLDSFL